jgi:hypothetical protein
MAYSNIESIQKLIKDKLETEKIKNEEEISQIIVDEVCDKLFYSLSTIRRMESSFQKALIKGVNFSKDPILSLIFKAKYLNETIMIQTKNRFVFGKSAILLGVIDPSGLLEENQIFV